MPWDGNKGIIRVYREGAMTTFISSYDIMRQLIALAGTKAKAPLPWSAELVEEINVITNAILAIQRISSKPETTGVLDEVFGWPIERQRDYVASCLGVGPGWKFGDGKYFWERLFDTLLSVRRHDGIGSFHREIGRITASIHE